ncbi:Ltp family lipoprotein [Weissella diestrammenae]|uniref:Ltp family lipoprotein n=1 Tax=Weissella diestrammenae TaxID=1162633 RepID=A0A7G9T5N4_9LACO|nr:Ltp family lipoprotein [Weissella diestrammenae]MCM0582235.1 Ltp family lipoprotein [Weissella diestrammenae]QNN75409.1 Ltp family lipoprotein [Weissella diestrammenae]
MKKNVNRLGNIQDKRHVQTKRFLLKNVWFWIGIVIVAIVISVSIFNSDYVKNRMRENRIENAPTEYKSAVERAKLYATVTFLSKKGIYNQLTSDSGKQYSSKASQFAIDNIDVDYKKNALKRAKTIKSESPSFTNKKIRFELKTYYAFTNDEINFAISNLSKK